MKVRVLYFAAARDLAGVDDEEVTLPPEVGTVGAFASWLTSARPAFGGRMGSIRMARNEAFAAPEERLAEGDVLAVLPPVAGG